MLNSYSDDPGYTIREACQLDQTISMSELLPPTTHAPLSLPGHTTSLHSSSGPYKDQKTGKILKTLRKKVGKILVRINSLGSNVPAARAEPTIIVEVHQTTIDVLPDDVLLQIFDFCRLGPNPLGSPFHPVLEWRRLIHVCQRWRQIMFSSPRRLDLYLLCTSGTPVRKNLGSWPALPIIVDYVNYPDTSKTFSPNDEDDIVAALEHPDRVRCLKLPVTSQALEKVATVSPEPFPILTQLWLLSKDENVSVLPGAFLGGSAPCLQEIRLEGIPFPTLPTLLSSATDLVVLHLHRIPHTGYISPEAMVAGLAAMTRLGDISIGFQSSASRPNQVGSSRRRPTPLARAILPALTSFEFRGASEYLEDLVAQIDTPHLTSIRITYFNQLGFQVPRLFRFIGETQLADLARRFKHAQVNFRGSHVYISLYSEQVDGRRRSHLALQISCRGLDYQVSHLAEVLSQSSAVLSSVGHLSIGAYDLHPNWRDDMDHAAEWLDLLRQFTAVETLRVSALLAGYIADALREVTVEMVLELLPSLHLLCLEDEPVGRVSRFITARKRSGLPVTIANTPKEFLSRRGSHLWI